MFKMDHQNKGLPIYNILLIKARSLKNGLYLNNTDYINDIYIKFT